MTKNNGELLEPDYVLYSETKKELLKVKMKSGMGFGQFLLFQSQSNYIETEKDKVNYQRFMGSIEGIAQMLRIPLFDAEEISNEMQRITEEYKLKNQQDYNVLKNQDFTIEVKDHVRNQIMRVVVAFRGAEDLKK